MQNHKKESESFLKRCPWCGQHSSIIWVHGHGQCSVCGYNTDECCRGETCEIIIKTDDEDRN